MPGNKELNKIKVQLLPVLYRDVLLQKKKTHLQSDTDHGAWVFYVNRQPTYYLQENPTVDLISEWAKANKIEFWRVIKKIIKGFDKNIGSPPLMATLFDWNPKAAFEEVELSIIPIEDIWSGLTEEDKKELLK